MRVTLAFAVSLALAGAAASAQQGTPTAVQMAKAEGLEVTYLNFGWNPEAFAAMETGGSHPAAGRSWLLARLFPTQPLQWQGKSIPANCGCLLVLDPGSKGSPMMLEIRRVDLGPLFADINVIASPPEGVTLNKAPANFTKAAATAARLEMDVKSDGKKLVVSIHFGDRSTAIELTK